MFLLTVVGAADRPNVDTNRLLIWDGQWYRLIAEGGYGPRPETWPPGLGGWTVLPFFPLFPASAGALSDVGVPALVAYTLLPNLAALAAAFGVFRVARSRYDARTSMVAAWILGLLPGALTFSMAYPDSIFLAASVWAVIWASDRRVVLASLAALVATASRPNGAVVVVVLAVAALSAWPTDADGRTPWGARIRAVAIMAAPSAIFLIAWMALMYRWTGDPIAFVTAKGAWDETTVLEWIADGGRQPTMQIAVGAISLGVVLWFARVHPAAWTTQAVLVIAPALVVGTVGIIRYSAQAFAVPISLAALTATRRPLLGATCIVLVVVSGVYAVLITRYGWVP
jgi:Gpi18-like mannosyltransferase